MSLTEKTHAGGHIISEANGNLSRENITVLSGQVLEAGAVIAKVTMGSGSSAAKSGGNTGNGAMGAITVGASAQPGVYQLRVTKAASNAGDFQVVDPQGDVIGVGTVGVAFSGGGLSFTLADGATDFVVGDGFDITVAAGSGKWVELNTAGTNGSEDAAGVLLEAVDASDGDLPGVAHVRNCELNSNELVWPTGISGGNKTAALAALATLNVIAR